MAWKKSNWSGRARDEIEDLGQRSPGVIAGGRGARPGPPSPGRRPLEDRAQSRRGPPSHHLAALDGTQDRLRE